MSEESNTRLDRQLDVSAKKTEDEWSYTAQRFFEKVTPLWFTWLGWVFVTGGVAYLAEETGSSALLFIEKTSYFLLMMYFIYFFASIRIEPYHSWAFNLKSKRKRLIAILPAVILSFLLSLTANALVTNVIQQIKLAN